MASTQPRVPLPPSLIHAVLFSIADVTRAVARPRATAASIDEGTSPRPALSLQVLLRSLARIVESSGAREVSLSLLLLSRKAARLIASSVSHRVFSEPIPLSSYPELQRMVAADEAQCAPARRRDPLAKTAPGSSSPTGSILLLPIHRGRRIVGALEVRTATRNRSLLTRVRAPLEGACALLAPTLFAPHTHKTDARVAATDRKALSQASPSPGVIPGNDEQFLEKIIQSSLDAIVVADRKGLIILFNKAAERISGYKASEVLGRMHIGDLYAPNVAREIMRRLHSPWFGGRGKLARCVEALRTKKGREIPIHILAATIYDRGKEIATVSAFTGLRDVLRLEKGVRESEEKYRSVVEQAHEGIGIVQAGKLRFANRRLREILGLAVIPAAGAPLAPHLDRDVLARLGLLPRRSPRGPRAAQGAPCRVEARLRGADTPSHAIEISASTVRYGEKPARQIFVRDLSVHETIDEAIARLGAAKSEMVEQQGLAELGTFSAGIAHEIRNPLGLIRSHLRLLQEAQSDASRESAIRAIERQIRRTSDLIEKILSYARPAAPVHRRIDLNSTVSMATRFAAQAMQAHADVEIRREFAPDLPRIYGDHVQLQEIFINLVTNALQAVGPGGTIRLMTAREGPDAVRVDVIDSGPGVREELREKIFLPFFTAGKGTKGTGMGLAIARRIVEGHRGHIDAQWVPEEGMRFRVVLPVGDANP